MVKRYGTAILGYGLLAAAVLLCLHVISLAPMARSWQRELAGALIAMLAMSVGLSLARRAGRAQGGAEPDTAPEVMPRVDHDTPVIAARLPIDGESAAEPYAGLLREREREVLQLLCRGRSNKQIARELNLSENTVKTHLASLYAKLQVNRRTQAQAAAYRLGLLAPEQEASSSPAVSRHPVR